MTYPFSWILIALVISWITKRPRLSKYSFRGGMIALLFFSNSVIFLEATRMWEVEGVSMEQMEEYDCAIVLGGMAEFDNTRKRLSIRRGGDRIWQAINLYHLGKVKKILISGNNGYLLDDELDEASQFKKVMIENGIPEEDILIENVSKNTYQNAVESKKVLDDHPEIKSVLLITSSLHMRRSRAVFEKVGFEDFDYFTTDHYTGKRNYKIDQILIPSAGTLVDWQRLIHEWIGYISYAIAGYV